MLQGLLVVFPDNKWLHFLNSEVACQQIIMVPANQLSFNHFRNVELTLMIPDSIKIFLVSAQFFHFDFLRLTLFCLQPHQPQSNASNASLIGAFCYQFLTEHFLELKYVGERMHFADNNVLQGCYMSIRSARYVSISQRALKIFKDFCIFNLKNFLLTLPPLRVEEQSFSSFIGLILAIVNTKMVARQLLGPMDLIAA